MRDMGQPLRENRKNVSLNYIVFNLIISHTM